MPTADPRPCSEPSAIGGTSRHAVRRLACVGLLAIGLIASAPGPALPGIRDTFHVTLGELGLLQVVSSSGYLLSAFVAGVMADHLGARRVLLAAVGALLAGVAGFVTTSAWSVALVGCTLLGCGAGGLDGLVNALVNEHSGDARGADLNVTHGFFGVGAVGGPLLGGFLLASGFSWRSVYAAGALATAATGVIAWRLRLGRVRSADAAAPSLSVLLTPVVALLAVVLCLYVGVELSVGTWAFTHLQTAFGAGDAAAGTATALFWAGIMVGRFAMGTIGARIGPHRLIVGNAVAAAAALACMVLAPTLVLAVVALTIFGVAIANIFPAVIAVAGEAYPHALGTVTGALIATGGVGAAIFPWLTGVVAEGHGLTIALGGGVVLLAAVLVVELAVIRLVRAG